MKFQPDENILIKYGFSETEQLELFRKMAEIYSGINKRINLISRKDISRFYLHHVLHSLAIAKFIRFRPGTRILDVGTGGGFPGIPLAIVFPQVRFHLIDSIGKKIRAVEEIVNHLVLKNVSVEQTRAENHTGTYDFIVSRAVTHMEKFVPWVQKNIKTQSFNDIPNGILYLKGGDLTDELRNFPQAETIELKQFFDEEFFETKKLVYLPQNNEK